MDLADPDNYGSRQAPFTRTTVAGGDQFRDALVELRIGHDDEAVFGAASGWDALPRSGGLGVDELRHRTRADERDAHDLRVIEDCGDGFLRAGDQVHDARREASLVDEVHDELHHGRIL